MGWILQISKIQNIFWQNLLLGQKLDFWHSVNPSSTFQNIFDMPNFCFSENWESSSISRLFPICYTKLYFEKQVTLRFTFTVEKYKLTEKFDTLISRKNCFTYSNFQRLSKLFLKILTLHFHERKKMFIRISKVGFQITLWTPHSVWKSSKLSHLNFGIFQTCSRILI